MICVALSHLMQFKETALYKACASGHVEVAATLLRHGTNGDKVMKRSYIIFGF